MADPASTETRGPTDPELHATGFFNELRAGWRFLRHEPVLLANTLQATVAQLTVGVLIGLTAVYAEQVFGRAGYDFEAVYAFIEGSQGAGNLLGGFVIGLIGVHFAKGRMVIAGYTLLGLLTTWLALSGNLGLVLGIAFGIGIANMVFVIPSQTLFQERTPHHLMGRVIGFRFALVFGAMTLSIGFGGLLAEIVGVDAGHRGLRDRHGSRRTDRLVRSRRPRRVTGFGYTGARAPRADRDAEPAPGVMTQPVTDPRADTPEPDEPTAEPAPAPTTEPARRADEPAAGEDAAIEHRGDAPTRPADDLDADDDEVEATTSTTDEHRGRRGGGRRLRGRRVARSPAATGARPSRRRHRSRRGAPLRRRRARRPRPSSPSTSARTSRRSSSSSRSRSSSDPAQRRAARATGALRSATPTSQPVAVAEPERFGSAAPSGSPSASPSTSRVSPSTSASPSSDRRTVVGRAQPLTGVPSVHGRGGRSSPDGRGPAPRARHPRRARPGGDGRRRRAIGSSMAPERRRAYADEALPIDAGQTISQPWIVARMTELLAPQPGDRILELGTGSGYQAAILAALGATVTSIERHPTSGRPGAGADRIAGPARLGIDPDRGRQPGRPRWRAVRRDHRHGRRPVDPVGAARAARRWRPARHPGRAARSAGPHPRRPARQRVARQPEGAVVFVPLVGEGGFPDDGSSGEASS